jgi:integrase
MANASNAAAAWELLGGEADRIAALSQVQRDSLVISSVAHPEGGSSVLSRFGDAAWDLSPYINSPGVTDVQKVLVWHADLPSAMVNDIKIACYAWKHAGRSGRAPPSWLTVRIQAVMAQAFVRWLLHLRLERFEEVTSLHVSNYLHHCLHELQLGSRGTRSRLECIETLWVFRKHLQHPMKSQPWPKTSVWKLSGASGNFETAATPIIPRDVQERLYNHCTAIIDSARAVLQRLEAGELPYWVPEAVRVRNAALYLVLITTGMRGDEALRIETGAYREEVVQGVKRRWVKTIESKTGKGLTEYLCPNITGRALAVMDRYVDGLHRKLAVESEQLGATRTSAEGALRKVKIQADHRRVFLSENKQKQGRVMPMSTEACRNALDRLTKEAGISWKISSHQTRRTYARMVVESKMGKASLIFLKWQLKHTSMAMTQGYASNPIADRTLVEDLIFEEQEYKSELLAAWTDDAPLSGGAGRAIVRLRAVAHEDREAMLKSAADAVHIRATGHGWCLSQSEGCGGAGLYEATRCVDCKDGVIDSSFLETWQGIYEQQHELLELKDVGPAVQKRAQREVRLAAKVLENLGAVPRESA